MARFAITKTYKTIQSPNDWPGCRSSSDGGGAGAHDPGGSGACSQGDHPEQGEVPGSEFGMAIWVC